MVARKFIQLSVIMIAFGCPVSVYGDTTEGQTGAAQQSFSVSEYPTYVSLLGVATHTNAFCDITNGNGLGMTIGTQLTENLGIELFAIKSSAFLGGLTQDDLELRSRGIRIRPTFPLGDTIRIFGLGGINRVHIRGATPGNDLEKTSEVLGGGIEVGRKRTRLYYHYVEYLDDDELDAKARGKVLGIRHHFK